MGIALFGDLAALTADYGNTWLAEIAPVWVCQPHRTDEGDPTRLVIFGGGRKVLRSPWR